MPPPPPPPVQAPLTPLQHCLFICQLTGTQIVAIEDYERIQTLGQFGTAFQAKTQLDNMVR